MRLSSEQRAAIKQAAVEIYGADVIVRLFGSRVNDEAAGGDIDLHIETARPCADFDHEVAFRARLWKLLDEPQIDVVVSGAGSPARWVDRAARREGLVL